MRRAQLLLLVAALSTVACGVPRDPEGTLERVAGGTIRVGFTENEPWTVSSDGTPQGVEPELVRELARSLDADVEWIHGSAGELFTALEERQLDLAIGGFVQDDPWAEKVAFTHPYAVTRIVVAVPPGVPPPEDLEGVSVAFEPGTAAGGLLESEGAVPVPASDLSGVETAVATEHWRLEGLGLVETGITLLEEKHVMATPLGENAWLVRLERFLLDRDVDALLRREGA